MLSIFNSLYHNIRKVPHFSKERQMTRSSPEKPSNFSEVKMPRPFNLILPAKSSL